MSTTSQTPEDVISMKTELEKLKAMKEKMDEEKVELEELRKRMKNKPSGSKIQRRSPFASIVKNLNFENIAKYMSDKDKELVDVDNPENNVDMRATLTYAMMLEIKGMKKCDRLILFAI